MSLGWGLRGYIGGGPLGAMIPGAMVALAICLLLERDGADAGVIAAFGAVGVGFGGQMTYGQTIGLSLQPDTMAWGLLGLWLKGAVWGLLGGAVIGLALVRDRYKQRDVLIGVALSVAGTYVGWKLINQPKLIYFSNRLDRPREEIWAGLLLGAILLLAWLRLRDRTRVPHHMALAGFVGGGLGFLIGGWFQVMGRTHWPNPLVDWWKVMEFTFGLLFGAALGWSAWKQRTALRGLNVSLTRDPLRYVALGALIAASIYDRWPYTIIGGLMLALALKPSMAAWHVAVTITATAFYFDLPGVPVVSAIASVITACIVERSPRALPAFTLLTTAAVADSVVKSVLQASRGAHFYVELTFAAMAVTALVLSRRVADSRTMAAHAS